MVAGAVLRFAPTHHRREDARETTGEPYGDAESRPPIHRGGCRRPGGSSGLAGGGERRTGQTLRLDGAKVDSPDAMELLRI